MATILLPPDFKEFLRLLNSARVEYLIVGGFAVGHYGHVRATADIDIWIATSPENTERVAQVLVQFGFTPGRISPQMLREVGKVFRMGVPPTRLELLTGISGVEFNECYARRTTANWGDIEVNIISLDDLRANKLASGRPKDISDLAGLA